jgi:hypothetical protein
VLLLERLIECCSLDHCGSCSESVKDIKANRDLHPTTTQSVCAVATAHSSMTQPHQPSSPHHSTSPTSISSIEAAPTMPHRRNRASTPRSTTPVDGDGRAPLSCDESNVVPAMSVGAGVHIPAQLGFSTDPALIYEPQDDLRLSAVRGGSLTVGLGPAPLQEVPDSPLIMHLPAWSGNKP